MTTANEGTCVQFACMRPDDTEAKLCELLLKITGEDIHQAREYESLYQFRFERNITSIRQSRDTDSFTCSINGRRSH